MKKNLGSLIMSSKKYQSPNNIRKSIGLSKKDYKIAYENVMKAKEMFEKLDIQLINEKPLIYAQDDGGYITEYLFNNITQCVQIKEYELFSDNKPQGSTTLSIELLQAINKQVEELGWNNA